MLCSLNQLIHPYKSTHNSARYTLVMSPYLLFVIDPFDSLFVKGYSKYILYGEGRCVLLGKMISSKKDIKDSSKPSGTKENTAPP